MSISKSEQFTEELQEIAKYAKAFSHPARIAILNHLAETKSCISGDIALELPLSRTTVSQHLQELKSLNLIQGTIDGLKVCYCINNNEMEKAKNAFNKFFANNDLFTVNCC